MIYIYIYIYVSLSIQVDMNLLICVFRYTPYTHRLRERVITPDVNGCGSE